MLYSTPQTKRCTYHDGRDARDRESGPLQVSVPILRVIYYKQESSAHFATGSFTYRLGCMGQSMKAEHLRGMLGLAKQLRNSASSTSDAHYVTLLLKAAGEVEDQANLVANSQFDPEANNFPAAL